MIVQINMSTIFFQLIDININKYIYLCVYIYIYMPCKNKYVHLQKLLSFKSTPMKVVVCEILHKDRNR